MEKNKKSTFAIVLCMIACIASIASVFITNFFSAKSAYDIAVDNGFKGTQQEWLASLKGDDGDTGISVSSVEKTGTLGKVDTYTITFSDGTESTFTITNGDTGATGKGIQTVAINSNNELIITFTDGTNMNLGNVKGANGDAGATGNGIVSIQCVETNNLIDKYKISYSDGTSSFFYVTNGAKGDTGLGIKTVAINSNNQLVVTLTNEDVINLGNVKGDTGATGNGISTIEKTNTVGLTDTYTITFTDGTSTTFDVTNGAKGDTGSDGEDAISIEQLTINRLNAKLSAVDSATMATKLTPHDRFEAAGITNKQLGALSATYLYSYSDNEFIAVDGIGGVAYTTSTLANYAIGQDVLEDLNLFTFVSTSNLSSDHSNYLIGGSDTTLNITTGLDVGDVTGIITINYTNTTGTQRNVLIRTNSYYTTLNINDTSSNSEISHYDYLGELYITQCSMNSYSEYGDIAYASIAKGHIKVQENGAIELLYKNTNTASDVMVEIVDINKGKVTHAHANSAAAALNQKTMFGKIKEDLNVVFDYPGYVKSDDNTSSTVDHTGAFDLDDEKERVLIEKRQEGFAENPPTTSSPVVNVNTGVFYSSIELAITSASADDVIMILDDISINSSIEITKNLVINLNGKTITSNVYSSRTFNVQDCSFTINGNNGTLTCGNDYSYGFIKITCSSANTTVSVNDLAMTGNTVYGAFIKLMDCASGKTATINIIECYGTTNYKIQDMDTCGGKILLNVTGGEFVSGTIDGGSEYGTYSFAIDSVDTLSKATFTNVTATSTYGPIIEVAGVEAEFTNCDFKITGLSSISYRSVAIAVSYGGIATINSGSYVSEQANALEIYPTGGTFNILGGTINGYDKAIKVYAEIDSTYGSDNICNISGGTFNGDLDLPASTTAGFETQVSIIGGTFDYDPTSFIATGYHVTDNEDGTYTVSADAV